MATVRSPSDVVAAHVGLEVKVPLYGFQATIATGSLAGLLADRVMRLRGLRVRVGTAGSAGNTVVQIHKNGTAVTGAEITVANTAADPSFAQAGVDVAIAVDDLVEIVCSTAPTAGADMIVDCLLVESY